ncbi:HNH endonuclease [Streptomyces brevispora]|uniref:HNH endonuclease n=1 Tax=Streptomyces brevispora TaxID=887462 RepID=UPI0037222A2A
MAQGRPDIPTALRREVLVEAGHRCAIQTCRQTPVELAHIVQWAKVQEHAFDNLIALCPTCHTRFDRGEIDRKAMLQYKANLDILNSRYTDFERQLLRLFVRRQQIRDGEKPIPENWPLRRGIGKNNFLEPVTIYNGMWWALSNLLEDGAIVLQGQPHCSRVSREWRTVALTPRGTRLVQRVADGEPI